MLHFKYVLFWIVVVFIGLAVVFHTGVLLPEPSYDRTTVAFEDQATDDRHGVEVRVADTLYERYIGLSRTESLDANEGMLFIHGSESECTYAMRGMEIPIDMIFVGSDRQVTDVHTAQPSSGVTGLVWYETYTAPCQWVVEVPAGWADAHNVTEGDVLVGVDD